jgi:XRE family transcriptional regulator, thiamine biosynthesis regulator
MMVDSFLPAMRESVARRLSGEGWSQGKIASVLGVTQASVSLYLRSPDRSKTLLGRLGISEEQAALYTSLLAEDLRKDPAYAVGTLYSLWTDALGRGILCSAHRTQYPGLAQCAMCLAKFGPEQEPGRKAVEEVASAVRMIEGSSSFVRVMPEVSVNVAYAPEEARSVDDVVAIPGRIVKVRGLPRSFMRPEYGASTHLASVLLAVLSVDGSRRAAINIRYDQRLGRIAQKLGLRTVKLLGGVGLLENLRSSIRGLSAPIDAIADPGGEGSEPGLYLFAATPTAVAELALKMARSYAAAR